MKPLVDVLVHSVKTALRNARVNPKTTAFGAASLASGIAMLQTRPLTAEIGGAGVTAILVGIGYLLADDPNTISKPNEQTTVDNKDR